MGTKTQSTIGDLGVLLQQQKNKILILCSYSHGFGLTYAVIFLQLL